MKKYIFLLSFALIGLVQGLNAYCVHNYTDHELSVKDSQSGHHRMGSHNVSPAGGSTCCAGDSKGCHPDKDIKNIFIEAKDKTTGKSFTCPIDVPAHGDIYIFSDAGGWTFMQNDR